MFFLNELIFLSLNFSKKNKMVTELQFVVTDPDGVHKKTGFLERKCSQI